MRYLAGLGLVVLVGCGSSPVPTPPTEIDWSAPAGPAATPWFEDVTEARGLHFVHDAGAIPTGERFFMPQIMGSGAALFDFDGDDRLDIYLIHNGGPTGKKNQLFHQRADGTFEDVSAGSGLDVAGFGMGVAIGDVNNDGRPDVVLTEYGRTRLFLNEGKGKFRDISQEAGIDNPGWGTSAAFVDYDRDGWLDLVVTNYVDYNPTQRCGNQAGRPDYCNPNLFVPTVTRLFHNRGGPGPVKFEDVTLKAGLGTGPANGLGVLCYDFDGDGWPDIFIASDGQPNRLWINQKNGTFKEEAVPRGLAYTGLGRTAANMGIALGDLDGDGLPDLFVTHLTEESHTFWRQKPRGQFRDETVAHGVIGTRWRGTGFGTVLADFNNDGWLDLALVNGRVSRRKEGQDEVARAAFWNLYAERNQLLTNDGKGVLRDISAANPAFCGRANVARALVVGDIDNDGALDLLVTEVAGPARLLRNVVKERGNWLGVRALLPAQNGIDSPACSRDAYGAEIRVTAGERSWLAWVNPGSSYLASCDARAHFGLGRVERLDEVRVRWPDGSEEVFPPPAVNQRVELRKGSGQAPGRR
jgi:hypothetical protein